MKLHGHHERNVQLTLSQDVHAKPTINTAGATFTTSLNVAHVRTLYSRLDFLLKKAGGCIRRFI